MHTVPLHRKIAWLVILFLLIGQIMLFSATGVLGLQRHGSEFYFISRQAACAVIGFLMMIAIAQVRYQLLGRVALPLLLLQIALVGATYVGGIGHFALGATRWLRVGGFTFQPSELAKVTVSIYLAAVLAKHREAPLTPKGWALRLAPVGLLLLMILKQPDLGTTVLLTAILLGLLFISGMKLRYCFGLVGVGGAFFLYSMLHSEYRRRRVMAFLNPWADPQGNGFQTIQSLLSLHSGKLFGVGLGNGNSKLFFLPEVHTDFIFALIGEELGFVGAIALLLLFIYFAYLLFRAAFHARDSFGCYLALGLSLSLVLQILVNLGGVTGLLPVKGLPLPFISWGRSALVVNLVVVGILLNIVKQSRIIQAP